eukprot:9927971-Alexandrium_andersonii.AAC.1
MRSTTGLWWSCPLCDFSLAFPEAPSGSQAARRADRRNSTLRARHLKEHGAVNPPKLAPRPYVRRSGPYSETRWRARYDAFYGASPPGAHRFDFLSDDPQEHRHHAPHSCRDCGKRLI